MILQRLGFLLIFSSCINIANASDTTLIMNTTNVVITGNKVSSIKLLNYANKEIGNLLTYTKFYEKEIIFTQYQNFKDVGIDFICVQKITPGDTKGLLAEIEIKRSFIDPERMSNPKQYWEVSIAFKRKNGNYVEIGTMEEYRLSYEDTTPKTIKETYNGTSRLLPFSTKKEALEFVTKLKVSLK